MDCRYGAIWRIYLWCSQPFINSTGLHHALNTVFWFDTIGINDIGKFQTGKDAVHGITGRYQAGFFPIMMFGMPAAALAMYHTAKTSQQNKYMVGS